MKTSGKTATKSRKICRRYSGKPGASAKAFHPEAIALSILELITI
jgi:hypothetical protein